MRALFAALLLLGALPAMAQTQVEGTLTLGGKVVALPPGQWRVLHIGAEPGRSIEGDLATTTHQAVLVQEHGGRAAAVILARAAAEVGGAWNPHGVCIHPAAIQRDVVQAVHGALDCRGLLLVGGGRTETTPAFMNSFYAEGTQRPGWLPPTWISVQVIQSQRMHYLAVEYLFAPSVFAPRATGASWNEGARSAAQNDVVQRLVGFGTQARVAAQAGLYGRQPGAALPWPF